ncbi:MAG TPA: hypothetical protein VNM48_02715, partial [Chloroflexota bacterium]|nr:hypothetical protein [Chloroflexota bacterium]
MARLEQRTTKEGKPLKDEWFLWIELPKKHPGDRHRKKIAFTGSKKAAETELRRQQGLAEAGKLTPGRLSVGQLFDRYLEEHVKVRLAPLTYVAYKVALTIHGGRLRAVPLGKLARHHLTEHEAYLANDARDRRVSGRKANLSPTTVARYLNPVKSALEW